MLTSDDGGKAIEVQVPNPASLILTDPEMPKVDGYQVIEYAKKNHPSVTVIIMTSSWSLDLESPVRKTGVVRCIEKPFRFKNHSDMVIEALRDGAAVSYLISSVRQADEKCRLRFKS